MQRKNKCFLQCMKGSHDPIPLLDKVEVILGRCPETKIVEKRCSKNQLSFIADMDSLSVTVKQVGLNASALNGVALGKNVERVAHHNDCISFLLGQFEHTIEFDPAPDNRVNRSEGNAKRKRVLDETESSPSKKYKESSSNSKLADQVIPSYTSRWETIDGGKLLVFTSQGLTSSKKVAAYDMDGTLILTRSGKVFPINVDDWKIMWPEIPPKLRKLNKDGFKIVIFTNQGGIARGKQSALDIKQKIERIVKEIGVPVQAFVATGNSIYRKPAPGMWDTLVAERNDSIPVDMSVSFYCGDAAGRPDNWQPKKKKDFSCSDRLMALNLGITFYTPEEHFLGQRPGKFNLPDFEPCSLPAINAPLLDSSSSKITSSQQELLLMVGSPGSGKSFVCRTHILPAGYKHVNRDTLGSWQKCVTAAKSALSGGHSVVVDNTNPDQESRARFIEVAKSFGVPCRCAVMNVHVARPKHNNKYRELIGEAHEPISEMVINSYKSKYQEPQLSEGFEEILKVNFIPVFKNSEHERLYKMYLLDKY